MKIRNAFIGILFISALSLTASQIGRVAVSYANSPITSPITGPVPTITPPLTAPVPTITITPKPTSTPKPVSIPTFFRLNLMLPKANTLRKNVEIDFYTNLNSVNPKYIAKGFIYYNQRSKTFDGYINIGYDVKSGVYFAKVKVDGYAKRLMGSYRIFSGSTVLSSQILLTPLTSSTPAPAVKYNVSGNVLYRYSYYYPVSKNGKLTYTYFSRTFPLTNIKVRATNTATKQSKTVTTDWKGTYKLELDKGQYIIDVTDNYYRVFYTSRINLNLKNNTSNINFLAYR